MSIEIVSGRGSSTAADPDELAAIVAVLESSVVDAPAPHALQPDPSRWRMAARNYEWNAS